MTCNQKVANVIALLKEYGGDSHHAEAVHVQAAGRRPLVPDDLRGQVAQVVVDTALGGGDGAGLTGGGRAEAGQAHVRQLGLQGAVQQDVGAGRRGGEGEDRE